MKTFISLLLLHLVAGCGSTGTQSTPRATDPGSDAEAQSAAEGARPANAATPLGSSQATQVIALEEIDPAFRPLFERQELRYDWNCGLLSRPEAPSVELANGVLNCRFSHNIMGQARLSQMNCELEPRKEGDAREPVDDGGWLAFGPEPEPSLGGVWLVTRGGLWFAEAPPGDSAALAESLSQRPIAHMPPKPYRLELPPTDQKTTRHPTRS